MYDKISDYTGYSEMWAWMDRSLTLRLDGHRYFAVLGCSQNLTMSWYGRVRSYIPREPDHFSSMKIRGHSTEHRRYPLKTFYSGQMHIYLSLNFGTSVKCVNVEQCVSEFKCSICVHQGFGCLSWHQVKCLCPSDLPLLYHHDVRSDKGGFSFDTT